MRTPARSDIFTGMSLEYRSARNPLSAGSARPKSFSVPCRAQCSAPSISSLPIAQERSGSASSSRTTRAETVFPMSCAALIRAKALARRPWLAGWSEISLSISCTVVGICSPLPKHTAGKCRPLPDHRTQLGPKAFISVPTRCSGAAQADEDMSRALDRYWSALRITSGTCRPPRIEPQVPTFLASA